MSTASIVYLSVDEAGEGQRLDNFLIRHLKGVPKTHIYRIIRSGEVRCNKGRCKVDTRLAVGDEIRVPPIRLSEKGVNEEGRIPARSFPLLYEDNDFLAINKPSGTAVHGGSGVSFGVIEQLRRVRPEANFLELVHRLDRETSGILLIAKKKKALTELQRQFKARETGKVYLTLVKGHWPEKMKVVDAALAKFTLANGERRVRVVAKDDPNALPSLSLVKVLKHHNPYPETGGEPTALLAVTIKTGRTHQIRVHLSQQGFVIAGDDKYGDFSWNKTLESSGLARMFLHAWRLDVKHPVSGEDLRLQCELPQVLLPWAKGQAK